MAGKPAPRSARRHAEDDASENIRPTIEPNSGKKSKKSSKRNTEEPALTSQSVPNRDTNAQQPSDYNTGTNNYLDEDMDNNSMFNASQSVIDQ